MSATRTIRTEENRVRFLEVLRDENSVTDACEAINAGRTAVYAWKKDDEAFARDWDAAVKFVDEALEDSALKRAIHGHQEPIVDKDGKIVGHRTKFETALTIFMLKARMPEKYHLEKKANAAIPAGVAGVLIAPSDMTPEEWIQAARGEAEARKDGDGEAPSGSGSD